MDREFYEDVSLAHAVETLCTVIRRALLDCSKSDEMKQKSAGHVAAKSHSRHKVSDLVSQNQRQAQESAKPASHHGKAPSSPSSTVKGRTRLPNAPFTNASSRFVTVSGPEETCVAIIPRSELLAQLKKAVLTHRKVQKAGRQKDAKLAALYTRSDKLHERI